MNTSRRITLATIHTSCQNYHIKQRSETEISHQFVQNAQNVGEFQPSLLQIFPNISYFIRRASVSSIGGRFFNCNTFLKLLFLGPPPPLIEVLRIKLKNLPCL